MDLGSHVLRHLGRHCPRRALQTERRDFTSAARLVVQDSGIRSVSFSLLVLLNQLRRLICLQVSIGIVRVF